jgi:hypothetical protein
MMKDYQKVYDFDDEGLSESYIIEMNLKTLGSI